MSNNNEPDGPWVIIPPTVLADERLSAGEKLVYGRVFGFIRKHGYCTASNDYLGKYIGMSKNTIRNYLSRLYHLKYLMYELVRDEKGEVQQRRIYPTLVPNDVLPRTTPRTLKSTKERRVQKEKNVVEKDEKEVDYFAKLLADKLNDQKSISFYKIACRRHDAHVLLRKAAEIVSDGQAKNPAAVFTSWLGTFKKNER